MVHKKKIILLYDLYLFCCFLVKSQKIFCHSVWFFSVQCFFCCYKKCITFHICCFLLKWQVTEYFLPVGQISSYKYVIIFHFDRKFISSWSLSSLLPSYKVTSHRKFSAILFLQIRFYFPKYFWILGSKTCINIVSVWWFKCHM